MVSILRIIDDIILIFKAIPAIIIWISLHYFTFEMWYIKAALNSDSFDVNLRNKNKITRIKTSVALINCFFLIVYAINDNYASLINSYQFYKDNAKTFSLIFLVQ